MKTHPALKNPLYRNAIDLLKSQKAFCIINAVGERIDIVPNSNRYNAAHVRERFKLEHDIDTPITRIEII